jgi:cytochrome c oxidase subunit III
MSSTALHTQTPLEGSLEWQLPARGKAGILALIVGESALFSIFAVAYVFYIGKSLTGPQPADVLEVPIIGTICLLSSSLSIWRAEHALAHKRRAPFVGWLAVTIALGAAFMVGTAREWHKLIYQDGLTISTNLFGTTFYSLVGLHALHVIVGLLLLTSALFFSLFGQEGSVSSKHFDVVAWYWHFVDVVWIAVFSIVYIVGR